MPDNVVGRAWYAKYNTPCLRRIDRKVDGLLEDFRLFNVRVVAGESHVAGLNVSDVQQNAEIDRIKTRLDRIERRLELTDR